MASDKCDRTRVSRALNGVTPGETILLALL
jgi:hypothetical protein